jgi:hypothetical protein
MITAITVPAPTSAAADRGTQNLRLRRLGAAPFFRAAHSLATVMR